MGKVVNKIVVVACTKSDKSWNHEVSVKVTDTNHEMSRCLPQSPWQVCDKPVCVTLMEFSLLQCTGKVGDKVRGLCREYKSWKSTTQIMKVGDVIYVADFRDLCLHLSQSQLNRIKWLRTACCKQSSVWNADNVLLTQFYEQRVSDPLSGKVWNVRDLNLVAVAPVSVN